jgi:hypothetical protein
MDLESHRFGYLSRSEYYCVINDSREAHDVISITMDRDMVNYFSRPERGIDLSSFREIYCLNPLKDDDCPVGICPNPDISGLLVRVARKSS